MMATSFVPFIRLFLCDTIQSKKKKVNAQLYSNNPLKIVVFKEAILALQAIALCGLSCHCERENYRGMKQRSETGLVPEFTAYIIVSFRFRVRL